MLSWSMSAPWSLGGWGWVGALGFRRGLSGDVLESSLATLTQGWAYGAHCWGKLQSRF